MESLVSTQTIKTQGVPKSKAFLDNYKKQIENYIKTHLGTTPGAVITNHFDPEEAVIVFNIFNDLNPQDFKRRFWEWYSTLNEEQKSMLKYLSDSRSFYTMFRQMVINWVLEYAVLDYVNIITNRIYGIELLKYLDGEVYNKKLFDDNFHSRDLDFLSIHGVHFELQDHPHPYNPMKMNLKLKPWKLKKMASNYPAFLIQLYLPNPEVIIIDPLQFKQYWTITSINTKPAIRVHLTEPEIIILQKEGILPETAYIKTTIHELPIKLYQLSIKYQHLKRDDRYNILHSKMIHKLIGELMTEAELNTGVKNNTTQPLETQT